MVVVSPANFSAHRSTTSTLPCQIPATRNLERARVRHVPARFKRVVKSATSGSLALKLSCSWTDAVGKNVSELEIKKDRTQKVLTVMRTSAPPPLVSKAPVSARKLCGKLFRGLGTSARCRAGSNLTRSRYSRSVCGRDREGLVSGRGRVRAGLVPGNPPTT